MSYQRLSGLLSIDDVDVSLAKLGLVVSVLLLGLRWFTSQAFLLVIPLAGVLGCGLYLVTNRNRTPTIATRMYEAPRDSSHSLSQTVAGYVPAGVFIGLTALVVSIHQLGMRTDLVYLLTGAIGVMIFGQLLFADTDRLSPGLVLVEIMAAALVLRLSALYATPGYVGVDIWTHATVFIDGIVRTGSLSPLAESKYLLAPFYHVFGAIGTLVFGSVRNGIYLSMGVLLPASALFIYATGRFILTPRWALLATAFYTFSDQFIRWGMHIIPTSLGLVFFLAVVYATMRVYDADAERWAIALLFISSIAVVFTHQVSTVITLLLLGVATVVATMMVLSGGGATPSGWLRKAVTFAAVFASTLAVTLSSWAVAPFSGGSRFLFRELAVFRELIVQNAGFLNLASEGPGTSMSIGGASGGATLLTALVPYIELVGFAILLAATIVGGLHMLHWNGGPDVTATFLLTVSGLFVVVFGLPLFGVRAHLPGRWIAFMYAPMVLMGALGLSYLSRTGSRRTVLVVFLLVALGYPTTMVVAEKATLDSPAFDDQFKRFAYTESELAAVDTIHDINPPMTTATIATDHPYYTLFDRYGGYGSSAVTLELGAHGPVGTNALVYRDYQASGPATFDRADADAPAHLPDSVESTVCPADWNVVYANTDAKLCTAPAAEGAS